MSMTKPSLLRTFKTYAIGQTTMNAEQLHEMLSDLDDDFKLSVDEVAEKIKEFDANQNGALDFEECWKLYQALYPKDEY